MHDFGKVQQDYAERLRRALSIAAERLAVDGLGLAPIDPDAIDAFRADWQRQRDRLTTWDWADREHRLPKGFNVAVWQDGVLCGLASGKLTGSKVLRVDYLEGSPANHPLKGRIIPIVLTCADAYRIYIGAKELKLYDVWEPLIPVYQRFGFELAPEGQRVHVMRRVTK